MMNLLKLSVIFFMFYGCSGINQNSAIKLPVVNFSTNGVDTLAQGAILDFSVWLSDTTYYTYRNPIDGNDFRMEPVFVVNDSILYSDGSDTLRYEHEATVKDLLNPVGNRVVRVGVIFPHPDDDNNLIRIESNVQYYLLDPRLSLE